MYFKKYIIFYSYMSNCVTNFMNESSNCNLPLIFFRCRILLSLWAETSKPETISLKIIRRFMMGSHQQQHQSTC